MAMWRKQEEAKSNVTNTSPEVREQAKEQPRVETPAPAPVAAVPVAPAVVVREATAPSAHLTSTLVIKGEITGRDDLFIDGEVQGKIRLEQGKVTIGPNGRVTADVDAQEIVIRGRVKGNLNGRDRVEIGKTGHATGDVVTQRILIEDGAEIHGSVEIKRAEPVQEKKKPTVVSSSPAVPTPATTPATATPAATTPAATNPAVAGKPANGAPAVAKNGSEPAAIPARESTPVA